MWRQLKIVSNYVVIEVRDGSVERFMNLCRFNQISMWDISKQEESMTAKMSKKDFLHIRPFVRKSKVHVRVKKKIGLGFLRFQYRKHDSFVIGIFLSLLIMRILSMFVWNISFTGNIEYTDEMLTKYLNEKKYQIGMKINEIDCNQIETEIRNQFEHITWVSAEIRGTRFIVHVKENDGFMQTSKDQTASGDGLYAQVDGIISKIITRKGTPLVHEGDSVKKGDELVSETVSLCNDAGEVVGEERVSVDADVCICTDLAYSNQIMREQNKKVYTGRTKEIGMVGAGNNHIELGLSLNRFKNYDLVTEIKYLKLSDDFYTPIWNGSKIYYEYEMKNVTLSDSELEEELKMQLIKYLHKLEENNVQICSNRVNMKIDKNSGIMEGVIEAEVTEGSMSRQ